MGPNTGAGDAERGPRSGASLLEARLGGRTLEAYCLKCRSKQEMQNPNPIWMKNGKPATEGTCPVSGNKMFKIGMTPAHESLPKPV